MNGYFCVMTVSKHIFSPFFRYKGGCPTGRHKCKPPCKHINSDFPAFQGDCPKNKKKGLENTAGTLSACDNSAAGAFFRVLAQRNPIFKRKRPISGHNHLHYSIYPKKIYCSSEIIGKERKPHFSGNFQLPFCQQITGSVPSFHCSVWMLNHSVPLP